VSSILNFAPTVLVVPDEVEVRKVDMSIELQILAFHEQRTVSSPQQVARRLGEVLPDARRAVSS
jgi:redox-sensing transcriptional repressor